MSLYEIHAHRIITNAEGWRKSVQIPTFFLYKHAQGIRDAEHARSIAIKILSDGLEYPKGWKVELSVVALEA